MILLCEPARLLAKLVKQLRNPLIFLIQPFGLLFNPFHLLLLLTLSG
ncbi:hypothetical protein IYQ_08376 [Aeromonas salmonicida subsp. salmonicida 01-B526]|uniref:Uncharacterized protein n=1 Tax=Aeromonas salmonicida subsp. salmonicida 01-B526 TaxID=1076135 RepID=A0ABN0E1E5_AERSS|nr:hypothetical protein IYQ_08376 [Aeromonas salmonicida subsp. salmonicida 01-B526]